MVAPRPLKPLVLYLAATPYSAGAAMVAVREEHQAKAASRPATTSAEATQDMEGLARTTTTATEDQAQQEDTPRTEEAAPSNQALGAPSS